MQKDTGIDKPRFTFGHSNVELVTWVVNVSNDFPLSASVIIQPICTRSKEIRVPISFSSHRSYGRLVGHKHNQTLIFSGGAHSLNRNQKQTMMRTPPPLTKPLQSGLHLIENLLFPFSGFPGLREGSACFSTQSEGSGNQSHYGLPSYTHNFIPVINCHPSDREGWRTERDEKSIRVVWSLVPNGKKYASSRIQFVQSFFFFRSLFQTKKPTGKWF